MTSAQTERRVLALLRNRYEADGFLFIEHPAKAGLSAFMGGYQPDALALGKDKSIAIEVNHRDQLPISQSHFKPRALEPNA